MGAVSAAHAGRTILVAADGSGQFTTLQAAIDSVPEGNRKQVVIRIKPGVYKERIVLSRTRSFVTLRGQSAADTARTLLTFDRSATTLRPDGKPYGTSGSPSVELDASHFSAEYITFENSAGHGEAVGQAVAVAVNGDKCVFRHCRFLGWQDTLYANGRGRQYYRDCYIEGHVDFIFGNAAAVFEDCEIYSKAGGCITAQSRTSPGEQSGYVFQHCRLTASPDVHPGSVYLSRPWRPYALVVYLHCQMGNHILSRGWSDWDDPAKEKTAFYGEYESSGPGAHPADRVSWSHQLTRSQAELFQTHRFLAGRDGWKP